MVWDETGYGHHAKIPNPLRTLGIPAPVVLRFICPKLKRKKVNSKNENENNRW